MYLNVLSFKNGKTLAIQTTTPLSVEKIDRGWNVIADEVNGQVLSFYGSEIVTIASQDTAKIPNNEPKTGASKRAKHITIEK